MGGSVAAARSAPNLTLSPIQRPGSFSIHGNSLDGDMRVAGVGRLPASPIFVGDGPVGVAGAPLAAALNKGRVRGTESRLGV